VSLESLQRIVAQTRTSSIQGTAFLVSATHVLTCAHCLGPKEEWARHLDLHFSRWASADRDRQATLIHAAANLDVALLRLDQEASVEALPLLASAETGREWTSFAHPAQVGEDGLVLRGQVEDAAARVYGKPALQLYCKEGRDQVQGASGAPVMVQGRVVGLLTHQLLGYGRRGQVHPVFNTLYALPVAQLQGFSELASHLVAIGTARQSPPERRQIRVFILLAQEDRAPVQQLEKHLTLLKREGLITAAHRGQVPAGAELGEEIQRQIAEADIVLLLVSIDFLAFNLQEMEQALERRRAGSSRVIPILIRPCEWQAAPFANLQPLPRDMRPVSEWPSQDQAWTEIAQEIRQVVEQMRARLTPPGQSHLEMPPHRLRACRTQT
jgi:hypothetical protein